MKVKLEQFLTLDSETTATVEILASAIDSMDRQQISNALMACDKLKEALAKNYVRRHHYTSLHRSGVQKNRLLDSLTHRVHIIEANGESYRLQESKRRFRGKRNSDAKRLDQPQDDKVADSE